MWWKRKPQEPEAAPAPEPSAPEPEQVPAAQLIATAAPLVIGDGQDPVVYARYRLDAIRRHIECNAVTDRFMSEARTETFSLLHALHLRNAVLPEEEAEALNRVGIGRKT